MAVPRARDREASGNDCHELAVDERARLLRDDMLCCRMHAPIDGD
jgi:hypothetical protein